MKHLTLLLAVSVGLLFATIGCSAKHSVETSKLSKAIASASAEVKTHAQAAITAIKAEKYEDAVTALAKLDGLELKPEVKAAVYDTLVDIQTILTERGGSDELLQKVQETSMKFL